MILCLSAEEALPRIATKVSAIIRSLEDNCVLAHEPYPAFVGEF